MARWKSAASVREALRASLDRDQDWPRLNASRKTNAIARIRNDLASQQMRGRGPGSEPSPGGFGVPVTLDAASP